MSDAELRKAIREVEKAGHDRIEFALALLVGDVPYRDKEKNVRELNARAKYIVTHIAGDVIDGTSVMLCGAHGEKPSEKHPDGIGIVHGGRAVATCIRCLQLDGLCSLCNVYHQPPMCRRNPRSPRRRMHVIAPTALCCQRCGLGWSSNRVVTDWCPGQWADDSPYCPDCFHLASDHFPTAYRAANGQVNGFGCAVGWSAEESGCGCDGLQVRMEQT